jgi:hypothetical protein
MEEHPVPPDNEALQSAKNSRTERKAKIGLFLGYAE